MKKEQGFGLIEVMVSLSIMMIVILALVSLSGTTSLIWENSKSRTIAQGIMQEEMESIHNQRDTNILGGEKGYAFFDTYRDGYKKTIGGKEFTVVSGLYAIDLERQKLEVIVKWQDRTGEKSIKGVTYITNWRPKY